jgi:hypothetical protein
LFNTIPNFKIQQQSIQTLDYHLNQTPKDPYGFPENQRGKSEIKDKNEDEFLPRNS